MSTKGKSLMKNNLKLNSLDPYDTTPINLTLSESSHTAGPKSKYVKFPQLASEKYYFLSGTPPTVNYTINRTHRGIT